MEPRVIVALDVASRDEALALCGQLNPTLCRLKVGSELYTAAGPELIDDLHERGFQVFLDLKLHDIPHTVAAACRVAAELGVWMLDVHAQGGRRMLEAARDALEGASFRPLLVAVTVLTSLAEADLRELGLAGSPVDHVQRLARLAMAAGADGLVCSPLEVELLRRQLGAGPCLVTPGIRPAGSAGDDQRRTLTPREALQRGASYLVVGRPVTRAADPGKALAELVAGLHGANLS